MAAEFLSFDPPAGESAGIVEIPIEPLGAIAGGTTRRFEFSCRGDRVPLTLITPESGPSSATLLVQPVPGEPGNLLGLAGVTGWLAAGVALASIELPLFGSRRSPKLSSRLVECVAASARGETIDRTSEILWIEFTRQSVMELRRALDLMAEIQGSPPAAVAFVGAGIGASLGALMCALDERPRGAVLIGTGGGFGPKEIDPASYLAAFAPRPLLLLNQESSREVPGAPAIPRKCADALQEAAREPVEVEWQASAKADLLEQARKFLSPLLVP